MTTKQLKTYIYALFIFSASVLLSQAQNSTTPPNGLQPEGSGDPYSDEDIYTLSPFEVTSDSDVGYLATSTLAGTRIRTDLRDVGSAISVVTEEMIGDVGATDNATLLQYTTNAEVGGLSSTYSGLGNGQSVDESSTLRSSGGATNRVRGLSEADNTRDFFNSDIPWDGYNVERIDIQRGPNSILFGLGKPGGMVNASLDSAEFFDATELSVRAGSYNSLRSNIDVNRVIFDDLLAIRIEGLWDHQKFRQKPAYENDERFYTAIRFTPQLFKNPSFRTTIKFKYEHGEIEANRPRTVPPNDHVSPWFRPVEVSASNPFGGMGKLQLTNGYEANREGDVPPIAGDNMGQANQNDPDYNAWVRQRGNQQQPIYIMDGVTNHLYRIYGGFINNYRNPDGSFRGGSASILGQRYAEAFYGIGGLQNYAVNAQLPGYQYGQYREQTMIDDSIFDFYNTLIDGPNKSEWENWEAYNISLSQTAFEDRIGFEVSYDKQVYDRGGEALLGGRPSLEIDILQQFQDLNPNANIGRPFVQGNGSGSSYASEREYTRASVFAEFRAEDVFKSNFLRRLIGIHRFNGVYSNETYFNETLNWNQYAMASSFDQYANAQLGIFERPPLATIYLGPSVADRDSASGLNIPGIQSEIVLNDGAMYHFSPEWTNFNVNFSDPWNIPEEYVNIFNPAGNNAYSATDGQPSQASNPANYRGWNTDYTIDILRYRDGDRSLIRNAQKTLRITDSKAFSWQSFWWDGAVVGTMGWRKDHVKSKEVGASSLGSESRNVLQLNKGPFEEGYYSLPDDYNRDIEAESFSWGAVVHLNKFFENDPLPVNVSFSYSTSDNFEVGGTRRNLYGDILDDPTGETKDYGILLSTKDNRYSLRIVKYEAASYGTDTPGSNLNWLGNIVREGLAWRNVFLYNLSNYPLSTANPDDTTPGNRYNYGPSPDETVEDAIARENAAIAAWNAIQDHLPDRYFDYWGYTPPPDVNNPTEDTVYNYRSWGSPSVLPPGLTLTSDTESEGYEFEFTANPTNNWRISFNASETEATRTNVGGEETIEFVNYISEQMTGPAGDLRIYYGNWDQPNTSANHWNQNFMGGWTLLRLLEGSAAPEIRKWRYNIVTNYSFDEGILDGLGIGGSYRWQDKVIIGYPVIPLNDDEFSFDLDNPYYGPEEDSVDLWVSYERLITDKITWKIQLNVRNAFASDGLIPISVQPDGETWASARIKPDRQWFITNTFSF